MVASIQSPADAVNAALRRIGYKLRVGSLYDGSEAARAALDVYSQTRDALLRSESWPFAQRATGLTTNGQTAPDGWSYEYTWPADCLLVRAIQPYPIPSPNLNPSDILFTPFNDNRLTPPAKVILTTISPAAAIYTAQITDPTTWEPSFCEALIDKLAVILTPALGDAKLLQIAVPMAQESVATALGGSETQPPDDAPVTEQRR
jgi:hypothetical protein